MRRPVNHSKHPEQYTSYCKDHSKSSPHHMWMYILCCKEVQTQWSNYSVELCPDQGSRARCKPQLSIKEIYCWVRYVLAGTWYFSLKHLFTLLISLTVQICRHLVRFIAYIPYWFYTTCKMLSVVVFAHLFWVNLKQMLFQLRSSSSFLLNVPVFAKQAYFMSTVVIYRGQQTKTTVEFTIFHILFLCSKANLQRLNIKEIE